MRQMSWLRCLALALLCACGDNLIGDGVALAPSTDVVIVAHQDDDLLFMQPDLLDAVQRGGVTTVYVTAGNGTRGIEKANDRIDGVLHAYAVAAGDSDWHCGWIDIAEHTAQHCRLAEKPTSLVFLAYPDGGREGQFDTSLLRLWRGELTEEVGTIAERTTRYDRDALIEVLAQILRETQPATIRTLEVSATHGRDHSDHMLTGALTVLAMARANNRAELISYRGYNITEEPVTKQPAIFDASAAMLGKYEACATGCGACGDTCEIDVSHAAWLDRRYAVGFRSTAAGRLRLETQCLTNELRFADCNTAPTWHLDDYGQLRSDDDRCLTIDPSGTAALASCLGGSERRFHYDDEGRLWSAVPPTTAGIALYSHLWCLTTDGTGSVRAQVCGAPAAAAWDFMPRTTATRRIDLGLTATGREVRLGDVDGDTRADLCAIESGALYCALGDGKGGFSSAAMRVDAAAAPLAIDPRSLTFGDVDGDMRIDACGRDSAGLLCATADASFAATRWSPSFNDNVAGTGTSASLAALDGDADGTADICGVDASGLICAPRGLMITPVVRSRWPESSAVVWPADLDGDHQADWCTATDAGPACAVYAHRDLTTDGAAWGFSRMGVVDITAANAATVAFGDIDGDGRSDQCTTRDDRITCARSQGRGFGPRTVTLAILPNQSAASALWLGDLDGDGRDDACADAGGSIICAVEP
jgi:LmbE family N-acetylglucosaminyl deacetylase